MWATEINFGHGSPSSDPKVSDLLAACRGDNKAAIVQDRVNG